MHVLSSARAHLAATCLAFYALGCDALLASFRARQYLRVNAAATAEARDVTSDSLTRLDEAFTRCREKKEAAFLAFVTAGYPHPDETVGQLLALEKGGADVIELGVPFSDPQADGATIQATNQVALSFGVDIDMCLRMVEEARSRGLTKPVVLMGYYNPYLQYGLEALVSKAAEAGVDGFIVVDLPPEEGTSFINLCRTKALSFVPIIAPTTTDARMKYLASAASSFIYCVSVTGVTGSRGSVAADLEKFVGRIRKQTNLPLAVGFGISSPEQVKEVTSVADGVVVGSAILNAIEAAPRDANPASKFAALEAFIATLKEGTLGQASSAQSPEFRQVPSLKVVPFSTHVSGFPLLCDILPSCL